MGGPSLGLWAQSEGAKEAIPEAYQVVLWPLCHHRDKEDNPRKMVTLALLCRSLPALLFPPQRGPSPPTALPLSLVLPSPPEWTGDVGFPKLIGCW